MKLKIMDFDSNIKEVEIPNDWIFLRVTILSGDEIVEVYAIDEVWGDPYLCGKFDARDDRNRSFFDATYIVRRDQIETWNNRSAANSRLFSYYKNQDYMKQYAGYISDRNYYERDESE